MLTRRDFVAGVAGSALAVSVPAFAAAPRLPRRPLPVLPVVDTAASGALDLTAAAGVTEFTPGVMTPSLGLNGASYLGPVVRMRRGREVAAAVKNNLREEITLHWHGLLVPGAVDGGPHLMIGPGETWRPRLAVDQPASMLWYHAHVHMRTATQVHAGLAGVLLIDDGKDAEAGLPATYGVDDFVVVLQDKRTDRTGAFTYQPAMPDMMNGFRGDTIVVNGVVNPVASVPRGVVRLRLLNAANARFFDLSFSDGRAMHLVATDLGLLPKPVAFQRLRLAPGERAEVLVDFAAGSPDVELVSAGDNNAAMGMGAFFGGGPSFTVLAFRADPALPASGGRIPAAIVADDPPRRAAARSRTFSLDAPQMGPAMMRGGGMMHSISGASFAMERLDFTVPIGTTERWTVNAPAMAHPFHVHGVRMRVLSENGGAPLAQNTGWKDTVVIDRQAELLVEFDQPASRDKPFMLHCHILEHEDTGMMQQFAVV